MMISAAPLPATQFGYWVSEYWAGSCTLTTSGFAGSFFCPFGSKLLAALILGFLIIGLTAVLEAFSCRTSTAVVRKDRVLFVQAWRINILNNFLFESAVFTASAWVIARPQQLSPSQLMLSCLCVLAAHELPGLSRSWSHKVHHNTNVSPSAANCLRVSSWTYLHPWHPCPSLLSLLRSLFPPWPIGGVCGRRGCLAVQPALLIRMPVYRLYPLFRSEFK